MAMMTLKEKDLEYTDIWAGDCDNGASISVDLAKSCTEARVTVETESGHGGAVCLTIQTLRAFGEALIRLADRAERGGE